MGLSEATVRLATSRPMIALYAVLGANDGVRQGPDVPAIAMTFDDGPHPEWTPRILDALDAAGARATFFVVGRCVDEHPDLVRDAHRRGHEIGTHLWSHDRATVGDDRRFKEELTRSADRVQSLIGARVNWLRFPYGVAGSQRRARVEREYGVRVAHWTSSSHDSRLGDPGAIVARSIAGMRPGAILLMHDRLADGPGLKPPYREPRDASVAALPGILDAARARGLAAVTLTALFSDRPR
jgi:peptidoglycan/xylan/chitin deacetylase (PgdA/CDA1 family)